MSKQKKSLGIMTLHRAMNYGALWQCWALKTICEQLGFDVDTIDYNPWGDWKYCDFIHHRPDKAITRFFFLKHCRRFIQEKLNPSEHINSYEYICHNNLEYDIVLVGSDQVWSPRITKQYLSVYLLDWLAADSVRIAYACSMGGGAHGEDLKLFKKELPKYTAISLREPQFIDEISSISGKRVVDVCDPVMLLKKKDYRRMEKKKCGLPKHYIVVMDLSGDSLIERVVMEMKKKLHLPIISIVDGYRRWADKFFFSLSPEQWLYVIDHADYMITNSFHGTAFSILLETPILCCLKSTEDAIANVRMTNLLFQTGLMNQVVTDITHIDAALNTNFEFAQSYIKQYRNRSYNWLKKVLYATVKK